jgi:hypothetical protein
VIHTAFIHELSKFKENCETDRRAMEAFGSALARSDRPLIVTSGTALLTSRWRSSREKSSPRGLTRRQALVGAAVTRRWHRRSISRAMLRARRATSARFWQTVT